MQTQPLVVGDVLYGYTPTPQGVCRSTPRPGVASWTFDSGIRGTGAEPRRDVLGGRSASGASSPRSATSSTRSTPRPARPIETFGTDGRIDLRENLGRDPQTQGVRLTTPGVIYKDLMILGGRVGEGLPTSPGDIRAYDVRTGALRWSFHTIPHPGELGYETWPKEAWKYSGGANSWAGHGARRARAASSTCRPDRRRAISTAPIGSATTCSRNSLIALDAATGKRIWHFQIVRHDLWDRDLPSPPTLVTVRRNGRTIDAVAQATKHGFLFVFDRVSGEPLFPIEYKEFPASTLPGRSRQRDQPIPTKPAPFARQLLTADLLIEPHAGGRISAALEQFKAFRSEGQFVPLGARQADGRVPGLRRRRRMGRPGLRSGDRPLLRQRQRPRVDRRLAPNTGGRAAGLYLQHCAACHRDDRLGTPPQIPSLVGIGERRTFTDLATSSGRAGRMPGFRNSTPRDQRDRPVRADRQDTRDGARRRRSVHPLINNTFRFTGYRKFLDPDGYPAVAPPWGTLNAINLNTGEYAWKIPLGEYPGARCSRD